MTAPARPRPGRRTSRRPDRPENDDEQRPRRHSLSPGREPGHGFRPQSRIPRTGSNTHRDIGRFVIAGAEYGRRVDDLGRGRGLVFGRCGRCVFDGSPTHRDVCRIGLWGIPSRDRADPQRGHVQPDDVVGGDIRSADPLARRVPRQPRRAATAHDACRDSGTAMPAGSITDSTGTVCRCAAHRGTGVQRWRRVTKPRMSRQALRADAVRDRTYPQFLAARHAHIHPHAGRRGPRTHPRHQPIVSTVNGSVRTDRVVPPAARVPCVAGWRPTWLSVTR